METDTYDDTYYAYARIRQLQVKKKSHTLFELILSNNHSDLISHLRGVELSQFNEILLMLNTKIPERRKSSVSREATWLEIIAYRKNACSSSSSFSQCHSQCIIWSYVFKLFFNVFSGLYRNIMPCCFCREISLCVLTSGLFFEWLFQDFPIMTNPRWIQDSGYYRNDDATRTSKWGVERVKLLLVSGSKCMPQVCRYLFHSSCLVLMDFTKCKN